jgi:His-Xaa-Ser system radical SAM maturase HxsC
MITLRARAAFVQLVEPLQRRVYRVVGANQFAPQRGSNAYLLQADEQPPAGFPLYLGKAGMNPPETEVNFIELPESLSYLSPHDVLAVSDGAQRLNVKWRHWSHQNSLLLTERCDHYCLMCSQPPKAAKDDYLIDEAFEVVRLLPRETQDIGFTGGEPTLYTERLIELLRLCRTLHPDAAVHVLSNGRRFARPEFAAAWASVDNPNMMVGIPLYGCEPTLHDFVVQAHGAFAETINGIMNLAALDQSVEIRVVLHKQTAPYLVEIAEFIARNLPFVSQVALMGLEMMGFARANVDDVWIDPSDYREELRQAVMLLDRRRIKTMIYNHQLCLIDREIWPWTVKSISDWKNEYHSECLNCDVRDRCGGFFFSAKYRMSDRIQSIRNEPARPWEPALLQLADLA